MDRQFRLARLWSNQELKRIAPLCEGIVGNISAGDDVDKEGATYSSYFTGSTEYWLTNYSKKKYRGFKGRPNEIALDLTAELSGDMFHRFDTVINHTTLEHIFEVERAFNNLCSMTRDLVILVVPFAQVEHEGAGYNDYWRFTPRCLRELFQANGFEVVYESANNDFNAAVYLFFVASRKPETWKPKLPKYIPVNEAASWIGTKSISWLTIARLVWRKIIGA